ncbi:hypothetical protein HMPREF9603_02066 [Cutibacterium acnes HL001PA1]|nr:hypothetical protein HMPREF9603_02066 [Cutibacterium acnes HL001PA1]
MMWCDLRDSHRGLVRCVRCARVEMCAVRCWTSPRTPTTYLKSLTA